MQNTTSFGKLLITATGIQLRQPSKLLANVNDNKPAFSGDSRPACLFDSGQTGEWA